MKEGALVLVVWRDSAGSASWSERRTLEPSRCETVGWLTSKKKRTITLSASRNDSDQWADQTVIPRANVTSIRRLL